MSRPAPSLSLAVFAATLALYAASLPVLSDGQILGNDVVPYAAALATGSVEGLWNPHHLGAHPLAALVAGALRLLGFGAGAPPIQRALLAQQLVSAVGGALWVALLFRFAAERLRRAPALALAACLAFAAGPWFYSAVGETYAPACAALAGLMATAARVALGERDAGVGARLAVGGWLLLAVLLRQDSILAVPVLFVLLPWRSALVATGAAGLASLALYAGAWQLAETPLAFQPWLRGLADTGLWGGSAGVARLGLGLAIGAGSTWNALSYSGLTLVGPRAVEPLAVALAVLPPLLLLGAVWPRGASSPSGEPGAPVRDPAPPTGRARCFAGLALFAGLRLVFFAWWQPSNMEYHTGTWVPLFLALALALTRAPARRAAWLTAAAALLLFAGNLRSLLGPARATHLHERAAIALEVAGDHGLLIALDPWAGYALLREGHTTFADATPLMVSAGEDPDGLESDLVTFILEARTRDGATVFFRDTALPPLVGGVPWPLNDLSALLGSTEGQALEDDPPDAAGPWGWVLPAGG